MQVCMPSTPAQMFHLLRRQMIRPLRKPLVVMTPKSLLRHKLSTSPLSEFTDGVFHNVIGDESIADAKSVKQLIACSGKVYFELMQTRNERGIANMPIVRVEQLYPFPDDEFLAQLKRYPKLETLKWCQEEPINQGAWRFINHRLRAAVTGKQAVAFACRPPSASPAAGYLQRHLEQQLALVDDALKVG